MREAQRRGWGHHRSRLEHGMAACTSAARSSSQQREGGSPDLTGNRLSPPSPAELAARACPAWPGLTAGAAATADTAQAHCRRPHAAPATCLPRQPTCTGICGGAGPCVGRVGAGAGDSFPPSCQRWPARVTFSLQIVTPTRRQRMS